MDLGRAIYHRKSVINCFHHDQAFHPDYGLVWHNGTSIFLSHLQFHKDTNTPTASSPSVTLGEFETVDGVHWSLRSEVSRSIHTDVSSYLCVQHVGSISVWAVSGKSPNLKCQKQTEHKIKALPQGCLWHPSESILCALSDREIHIYNAHTTHWKTITCDGKISAGCWVFDGSKFIVAMGPEVKVYLYNPETHTLHLTSSRTNSTTLKSSKPGTHIKSMVAVSDDLVAIATDLPLDSLICQTQHNPQNDASVSDTILESDGHSLSTPAFSLIIPNECIVKNPVAEILKDEQSNIQMISVDETTNACLEMCPSATEDMKAPSIDTLGDKLDQILNLMKKMDDVPDVKKSHLHQGKKSPSLCSKLESNMHDGSRKGPIDVTSMMSESDQLDSLVGPGHSEQSLIQDQSWSSPDMSASMKFNHQTSQKVFQTKSDFQRDAESPAIVQGKSDTISASAPFNTTVDTKFTDVTVSDPQTDNQAVNVERECDSRRKSISGGDELSKLVQNEISQGKSGPVDVTALLAVKSVERTSEQQVKDSSHKHDSGSCNGVVASDDIIDLTGLKANVIQGDVHQTSMSKSDKIASSETAKLILLRVSANKDPTTMTSVDLPGILTPDLLCFQRDLGHFVVGTNAQKQLLVYTLCDDNLLTPSVEHVVLPGSHRPLGLCSIWGNPSASILVLAGESQVSATEGAFLSFSPKIQLDLKLFSFRLQKCLPESKTSSGTDSNMVNVKSEGFHRSSEEHLSDTPMQFVSESLKSTTQVSHNKEMSSTHPALGAEHLSTEVTSMNKQGDYKSVSLPASPSLHYKTLSKTIPMSHIPNRETPSHTMNPMQGLQDINISHGQGLPSATHQPVGSKTSKRWSWSPGQRPWSSGYRTTSSKLITSPDERHRSSGSSTCTAMKYPYPEYADLLHLTLGGLEGETPVPKSFLLNQHMIKLQVIKDAFQLDTVEIKIRDNWVVLTEDADGHIPLCFSANASHTIKGDKQCIS